MRQFVFLFGFLVIPILINSQTLKGKVYDATAAIKGIKIYNETQNSVTATNDNGNFSIIAKVNDTLLFQSLFHHPKAVVLKPSHFEDIAVFELKKIVNELEEVEIKAEPEQPVFEEKTYNETIQNLIKEDIKRNPQLYQPANSGYGVDFIYLIGQVAKLLKRKKPKLEEFKPITYKQLTNLIEKSSFFNDSLLIKDLKIPKDNIFLFLEFCEAKQMSSELLKDTNKMQLLEHFVLNSQLYLILLKEYSEEPVLKN